MSINKAYITHLFHSSFLIEINNNLLVFDYFDYASHYIINSSKILTPEFFSDKQNVYVFVSHSHKDHYDPLIFKWQEANPKINYILSNDIKIENKKPNYYIVDKYESFSIDNIKISTFGSTDLGVSYLIKVDGITIFHAGDLNWWCWKNDTIEAQQKEEKDFKKELDKIKEKKIDIAFFPVDPRLDENYYLGGEYFAKTIIPKLLVPMHFSDKFYIPKKFKKKIQHLDVKVADITERKRNFIYETK